QLERTSKALLSLFPFELMQQSNPQAAVSCGVTRVECRALAKVARRFIVSPTAKANLAKIIPGFSLGRIGIQDLPIKLLRAIQFIAAEGSPSLYENLFAHN